MGNARSEAEIKIDKDKISDNVHRSRDRVGHLLFQNLMATVHELRLFFLL